MIPMGLITRIGQAPGVRRLVRKRDGDGIVTESPDPQDRDPRWCATCGREVLLGLARCLHCGGAPLTVAELARQRGDLPHRQGEVRRPGSCNCRHRANPARWPARTAALISDCHPAMRVETSRGVTTDEVSGCVIVTGMPGAGKTTITSLVAQLLPRGAQVGGDAVNLMVRSGFVWFMGEPTEEALRHDELCNRNMCSLANNFIDFGFTALMDTVLADRAELDFFIALMSPRPVRVVVLDPGIDVCKARNAGRNPEERFEFDGYERLDADMKREFGDIGWWLDTSAMTADQTAERLAAEMASRTTALLPGWNSWLRRLHGV